MRKNNFMNKTIKLKGRKRKTIFTQTFILEKVKKRFVNIQLNYIIKSKRM